ncbi:hypothetical protein PROAA_80002 [Candidatus Propionivibrio aalborgensis]|uniref:Uncharacterized protein n=1 Tax=Candidatus Propionivibrio aalborgensis TaxID=1860101 RepID=A0A1A8Y1W5_9RHOO|nr:hypothetical protein PROAA_80002 [Candidatus Propionivibrio aalborgensis]
MPIKLSQFGHEQPLDASGKQPSKRLLYLGTCRKSNSRDSAIALVDVWPAFGQLRDANLPPSPTSPRTVGLQFGQYVLPAFKRDSHPPISGRLNGAYRPYAVGILTAHATQPPWVSEFNSDLAPGCRSRQRSRSSPKATPISVGCTHRHSSPHST